jgi:bifunctional DNA-binding transcriptional regulator/antitoxin component of YhaV-PrlF toxin-antitoxin module
MRIGARNQITVPMDVLRRAGLQAGDELRVECVSPGRIVLVRTESPLEHFAGILRDAYPPGCLSDLRAEWDSRYERTRASKTMR